MTIRIVRNEAGNCLNFFGSSNPAYFNACLSAEVDPNDSTLVNVINDIYTAASGEKEYEFYRIPYTEFVDADSNPFADAVSAAQYITDNGNVVAVTNVAAQYRGVWDASTNTPDLTTLDPAADNGDWFYVSVEGTHNTVEYAVNDVIKYNDDLSVWQHVPNETVRVDQLEQEVSEIVYTTETALFNTDTSIFADGDPGLVDPSGVENGWYYQNGTTGTGKINWYFTAAGAGAPQNITVGSLKSQFALIKVLATGVPYFNIYTQPQGDSADAASWYRSRQTFLTFDSLDAYVGQDVLIYRGEDPSNLFQTVPHIEMELEPSTSVGPAGTDELVMFGSLSTSTGYPAGTYEFIAKSLGFKNNTAVTQFNLDTNDPVAAVASTDVLPTTDINFHRDDTNTSVIMDHTGESYGVNTIKAVLEADGTISIKAIGDNGEDLITSIQYDRVTVTGSTVSGGTVPSNVVNALNALFTVNPIGVGSPAPTLPTLAGSVTTYTLQEGSTPVTGSPTHLYTTGADTNTGHGARLWTNETIDASGEYFDVKITGNGRFILGLVDNNDATLVAELSNDSGNGHNGLTWGNAIYDYGSYSAPWTTYGRGGLGLSYGPGWSFSGNDPMMRYNTQVQDNIDNMDANLYRVGLDNNGYIYVAYYDVGRTNSFIVTARTSVTTPASDYALVVKLWSNNTTIVEAPTRSAIDDAAPSMNFRYIESPDGVFHYPVFATAEEAEYYDEIHNGLGAGNGSHHTHVYADDPTSATWYMPESSHDPTSYSYSYAPSAETFDGNNVTYTEITSLTNADLVPTQYSDYSLTVDEGGAVNLQITPQEATWTTTVTGLPAGLAYDALSGAITGSAPAVTGDNVANPSDEYTVTVTRTNSYGSSSGTLTLTVTNLTAPTVDTGDWSVDTGTITAGVLQENSLADLSFTLSENQRVIIPKEWVDAHVQPNGLDAGDRVFLGILKGSTSTTAITVADFNACFRWEGSTSSSHAVLLNDQLGSSTGSQTFTNNGASVYDYAIELYNGQLYLIACNVNSINTEPAVAEGGSFSRTLLCGDLTDDGLTEPYTIKIGTYAGTVVDLDDSLSSTDITKITIPSPPVPANQTSWTKALDFSGSSERAEAVSVSHYYNPMLMDYQSVITAAPSTSGNTSNDTSARPWATACVFSPDGNSSNQHIWNIGEGAGSTDDNIYLRMDQFRNLYFGWGRDGAINEYYLARVAATSWNGVYVGFNGTRLSGANATTTNLSAAFDIRLMFNTGSGWGFNPNPTAQGWGQWTTSGGRMDRSVTNKLTIGGRGTNRSFHGKVASFVTTTLRRNVAMPDSTEIAKMVTDPVGWLNDYKVGNDYRPSHEGIDFQNFLMNNLTAASATQVWLMGDGSSDSYTNMIRNQVMKADQNYTKLNMVSMVSNDIQTVNISGLS